MKIFLALSCFVLWFIAAVAHAQDPQVIVTVEQEDVIVGQPYILRVEILVPTFMPKSPIFPTFEVPGLLVRLPERSTSPISERIDGETWAGVRRTYRIYPMQAGVTEIPPQQISIIYKDPATSENISVDVDVPATRIVATVPVGARTLDPVIIARGVTIEQSWQASEGPLNVGDAVVRQLEISVVGGSALFVPPLLTDGIPSGRGALTKDEGVPEAEFLPYPEDAVVTESLDSEGMAGMRTEKVTYVAQSGGTAAFPEINLDWFNLETGEVETIAMPGRVFDVTSPPVDKFRIDVQASRRAALYLVAAAAFFWSVYSWLWPALQPKIVAIRRSYEKSAQAAHQMARRAAALRDIDGLLKALEMRESRGLPLSSPLKVALQDLTRAVYRDGESGAKTRRHWQEVQYRLSKNKPGLLPSRGRAGEALKPLNPFP